MGEHDHTRDPEADRVEELLDRAVRGTVTEVETEELALYAEQTPALRERIADAARQGELGQGWLDRVYRDQAMQRVENSSRSRAERLGGLGLVALGYVLHFVNPVVAAAILTGGVTLLLYSFIRVRVLTHRDDPYKDIQQ